VFNVVVVVALYFVINSVRKLLDTPSYLHSPNTPTWRALPFTSILNYKTPVMVARNGEN